MRNLINTILKRSEIRFISAFIAITLLTFYLMFGMNNPNKSKQILTATNQYLSDKQAPTEIVLEVIEQNKPQARFTTIKANHRRLQHPITPQTNSNKINKKQTVASMQTGNSISKHFYQPFPETRVTINKDALEQKTITIKLPNLDSYEAKRVTNKKISGKTLSAFSLINKRGSFTSIHTKDGIEKLTLFDVDSNRVFKGTPISGSGSGSGSGSSIVFREVDIHSYICLDYHNTDHQLTSNSQTDNSQTSSSLLASHKAVAEKFSTQASLSAEINEDYIANGQSPSFSQVQTLQSKPSAEKVLYIDYWGGALMDTAWNANFTNGEPIVYDPYDTNQNPNEFTNTELATMYAAWEEVAEDYAPFEVNITTDVTVYNATPIYRRSRIISTRTNEWFNESAGGVAYLNSFGLDHNLHDEYYSVGWSFNTGFASMGVTHSHESGHQMGLVHDGDINSSYYSGHGNWGSIMGDPFLRDFTQWNDGTYPNARHYQKEGESLIAIENTQDDFNVIESVLGISADDVGNTNNSATTLSSDQIGIITPKGSGSVIDTDVYTFSLDTSQSISITARPLFENNLDYEENDSAKESGSNLSAKFTLTDSQGTVIAEKTPTSNSINNNFIFSQTLNSGSYFFTIEPQSYDSNTSTGFNEYGNGGYYQILTNLEDTINIADISVNNTTSNRSLSTNEDFLFTSNIVNNGNIASSNLQYQVYRSTNSTIDEQDTLIINRPLSPLSENSSLTQSDTLNTGNTGGVIYYYGACVVGENDQINSNNCSTTITQIYVLSKPDLVFGTLTTTQDTAITEETFSINTVIENTGFQNSTATTLRFYRSTNAIISTNDVLLGTDSINSLANNVSSAHTFQVTAPSIKGTYYFGACIDAALNESNVANNCSSAVALTVISPPDLSISSFTTNTNAVTTNAALTLSAQAINTGDATSSTSTLRYYLSNNATIDSSDTLLGANITTSLQNNQIVQSQLEINAPSAAGTYFYGVCIDNVDNETITNNNCSMAIVVFVTEQIFPDLSISNISSSGTNTESVVVVTGGNLNIVTTIANTGSTTSTPTSVQFYLSNNDQISFNDSLVSSENLPSIAVNSLSLVSATITAPNIPGDYYFGSCVTPNNNELDELNNCSSGVLFKVIQGYSPDSYETNNVSNHAKEIINQATQIHSIHEPNDVDWLQFSVNENSNNLEITIDSTHANLLNYELLDSELNSLFVVTDASLEMIALDTLPAGEYYIQVNSQDNQHTVESYEIQINFNQNQEDDDFCFPIKAKNSNVVLICL